MLRYRTVRVNLYVINAADLVIIRVLRVEFFPVCEGLKSLDSVGFFSHKIYTDLRRVPSRSCLGYHEYDEFESNPCQKLALRQCQHY